MPLRTTFEGKSPSGRWPRRISKRKVLSVNMISLPLADFRHLAHIGSDAHRDSFGDLSFLKKGHGLLRQSSQSEQNLFMACAPPPKPPRLNLEETEPANGHSDPDWDSQHRPSVQRRKKCSSLPLLDTEEAEEEEYELHAEEAAMIRSPGRGSLSSGRDSTQTSTEEAQPEEPDTGFSFNLDLGPSILDDVLRVMERINQ
ncbi:cdc42 effector protein 3-like [Astyanax mexicanus]|uniref:Cdc42 effector protein 3-like n=2 Tax=Astyanax mexicanus TaxID=7994 RepID=A0A8B9GU01_ASTMX|nr:cdc42 effector protein 3-like [Astyanax mexicanus]KAG9268170.1 cdc42 effector protein 3-like [Astyanax mexicanus]